MRVSLARPTDVVASRPRMIALVGVLALAACRDGGGGAGKADGTDAGSDDGTAGDSGDDGTPGACASDGIGVAPLRRLSHREYDATVRDLLGDTSAPSRLLPTDASANGFDTNASAQQIDALLAEGYMNAAEDVAARAVGELAALLPCDPAAIGELACGELFIDTIGPRAFRRPLAADEVARYRALLHDAHAAWGLDKAIELVLSALLQSPSFLFRLEFGLPDAATDGLVPLSSYELASRLSYLLWGTMPDAELFAAAAENRLGTAAELAAQAERMLADPRARELVSAFSGQWMGLAAMATLDKDPGAYPAWGDPLREAMRAETTAFVDHVVFDAEGDLATILGAPYTFVNAELAALYGVAGSYGEALERVELPPGERAGVLTHGSVLALTAKRDQSSPVVRGAFVRERFLCESLPEPPPNVDTTPPEVDPDASTRERFEQHSSDPSCAACHQLIDPLGFGLEHYDGIGRWRAQDGGVDVDASGTLVVQGESTPFDGAIELAALLTDHAAVRDCFVSKWFEFGHARAPDVADTCTMDELTAAFADGGGDVQTLLIALTQTDAFRFRPGAP